MGSMKKMVVWEVSSNGRPHPWNQGFAWEALRKWSCGRCLPRIGRTPGTKDLLGRHSEKGGVGGVFQGSAAPLEPRICLGGSKKMVVWEVSSKGRPHPWNQGFAWETLS